MLDNENKESDLQITFIWNYSLLFVDLKTYRFSSYYHKDLKNIDIKYYYKSDKFIKKFQKELIEFIKIIAELSIVNKAETCLYNAIY
jgi:hypothetical protein